MERINKMLEILPIQSKTEQEALCARCNITYDPELMAYGASVDGESVGICQFTISDKGGSLIDIAQVPGRNEFETAFLLGRAALNFIDLCGVHCATYDGNVSDESLIRAIGFTKTSDGKYVVDLTDFFTNPCQHHKNRA